MNHTSRASGGSGPAAAMILCSCVSLQFGGAIAVHLFPTMESWGVTTLRLGFAAIVLLVAVRPRFVRWSGTQWRSVVFFAVALAGMNGTFYCAIERLPLGAAVAIEFLGPLLLSAALSRRAIDLAWVVLAFLGIGLLGVESITQADSLDPVGVVFALIAGSFWVLYILTSARVGQHVPGTGGLAMALVLATVFVLPMGASGVAHGATDPTMLGLALAIALMSSVIPYTLELAALRRLPRNVFGILLSLEPIVAALAGWVLLHQPTGPLRLAAIALVIVASIGTIVTAPKAVGRAEESPTSDREPVGT
ncbi:DMT family transporter [Gordonia sp. ABSL11-1]|uniref:EamA family transporter n=1 Tax=Gordonia sp. ABSL11-1 TaxID=3053924 RepID=UPI002574076E|nr:DMT family transporter [Gordonia sp. ABSL11-1]MDL9946487.1 DMT family transporter [Gordonia sp. ABSL11-1]